ncbi:hypothetical protein B0F90DRAFT_1667436 [Multifurca ochricompacta]|uniref:SET domain-containing protein n=1 Tax=Multifurca ochricompacta TaxID=376703 RepID=A0AAD4M603_9AGAM|nr:hypothetical protein B0F90DRAFT_1667436 [Multifurca ochricompacta]
MFFETLDDAGFSMTPTLVLSENSHDENRALAFRVYKEVWDEFNKWKVEDCKQQLLLLRRPLPPSEATESASLAASELRPGEPGDVEIIYLCDSEDDVPLDADGANVLTCKRVSLKLPPDFEPHPRYEACTPALQTVALRPGSAACDELDAAPFVPYADDPTFNAKEYLREFKRFAWEELVDPDVEVIQFETLRRLHFGHGLSLDLIDATNVLPPLRSSNRFGLLYQMTQRESSDELFWTGMMDDLRLEADGPGRQSINFRAQEPDADDLRGRIDSIVPYFCGNPGCIHAFCPRHVQEFPPIPPTVPRVASNDYPDGPSCGSMCFQDIEDTFQEETVKWSDSDIDELRCILEIIPDTTPCGLAKLVFIQRRRLIPDDRIYPESDRTRRTAEKEHYSLAHVHILVRVTEIIQIVAARESLFTAHAVAIAVPPVRCQRRWRGCRCRFEARRHTCSADSSCPCRALSWECDPMVCECDNEAFLKRRGKLGRRQVPQKPRKIRPDGQHFCQNSDIQRGLAPELEVKRGAYGLGAFAVNRIRKDQYIGEYIGELVPMHEDKRGFNIDSARVGNETRYINHGNEKARNAHAETKLVFGDHHIGFYALRDIKAGEEILFDYGEHYWIEED